MKKNVLITGGTVFVSRFVADWCVKQGWNVWTLNRGNRPQVDGVTHICADRHALGDTLKQLKLDAVLDMTAYTAKDVSDLCEALPPVQDYVLLSSSAVYLEYGVQPFKEDSLCARNSFWGDYGTNKIEAEKEAQKYFPNAFILRPPYLYGPMENLYREPFVFDCAAKKLPFYLPGDGSLPLQFFHVEDLCRLMALLLEQQPEQRIYNVGNAQTVTAKEWVELCYAVVGEKPTFVSVEETAHDSRSYFPFRPYAYRLDITQQNTILETVKSLETGLREAREWYRTHPNEVNKKPYFDYIAENLRT